MSTSIMFQACIIMLAVLVSATHAAEHSHLGQLKGFERAMDYPMPAYDSPTDAWAMIDRMCGPVGEWDREIVLPYRSEPYDRMRFRPFEGCLHIKGELGPNGEKPRLNGGVNATFGYNGDLKDGGLFVENLALTGIGIPNNKYFVILRNLEMRGWGGHALITSGGNKHMYLELTDSYAGFGNSNHAIYIDNIAFANIQRNKIESPGKMHALRSIAQKSIIRDNLLCNIQCNGEILENTGRNGKTYKMVGMHPLDVYVNGEHLIENNKIVYHRPNRQWGEHAAALRGRKHINSLDRLRSGDKYVPVVWGTKKYNDPSTWNGPMLDTYVKNLEITCTGEPCKAWNIKSTYPWVTQAYERAFNKWWKENEFTNWDDVIEYSHPSWHGTLALMPTSSRRFYLDRPGKVTPGKLPHAVPQGWQQKSRITFENVTGNFTALYDPATDTGTTVGWCLGEIANGQCVNQKYYRQAEVVVK